MAQRFKKLNKNAIFLDKNKKTRLESFIQMVFFHKIDVSFLSIESNGLVEIQEYTCTKSFELS